MNSLSQNCSLFLSAGLLALSVTAHSAAENVAVALPCEADFESVDGYVVGPLATDSVWNLDAALSVDILPFGAIGNQSLGFTGGHWLWLNSLGLTEGEVTWLDFYLIPTFAEADDLPIAIESAQSAVTGFVKVDPLEGEVYAIDGDGLGGGQWLASGERTGLSGNASQDWVRLTYRLDYANKQWDLFVNGKMTKTDLGFLDDTVLKLTEFALRGDHTEASILDYFYSGDTNPLFADSSNDGLSDVWLSAQGLNALLNQRYNDGDADGLDNLTEFKFSTRADLADTDGDGADDGVELAEGLDPNNTDTDGDGAQDGTELTIGTDPKDPDTDYDGALDGPELADGTDPLLFDTDSDGLADSLEAIWSFDPLIANSGLALLDEAESGSGIYRWVQDFDAAEGFVDGSLNGQESWIALGDVQVASEQIDVTDSLTEDASFERLAGVGEMRQLAIQFRAKLLYGGLPDLSLSSEPAVAVWGASGRNAISIWHEGQQQWQEYTTPYNVTQWNDYTIYLDYESQLWQLRQNGALIASQLVFKDNDLIVFSRFKALQSRVAERDPSVESGVASFDSFSFDAVADPDLDSDNDGLVDGLELAFGSDPFLPDTDGDGIIDLWEYANGLNPLVDDADQDTDEDGLSNEFEWAQFCLYYDPDGVIPTNPNLGDEFIVNGNFSVPHTSSNPIGGGARWGYWAGIAGWSAVLGENVELQSIQPAPWQHPQTSVDTSPNQYCELNAHPSGSRGIKQVVRTVEGRTYLLAFDYATRESADPAKSNFSVRIAGNSVKSYSFSSHPGWQTDFVSFTATADKTEIAFVPIGDFATTEGAFIDFVKLLKVDVEWESQHPDNEIEEFSASSLNYSEYTFQDLSWLDGKRYFPGADSQSGTSYRNKINVKVSVPGYKNGKVKLRAFDVDDPTSITGVDDDSGSLGDDNNELDFSLSGEFSGVVTVGTKESISLAEDSITLLLDDSGEGVAEFILSPQPGNNYRIAAELLIDGQASEISNLQVASEGATYVSGDNEPVAALKLGSVSEMLTVWRKLHVEVDVMEKWTTLGEPDRATATGKVWQNALRLELEDGLPEGDNFYEDGKVIGGSSQRNIIANTDTEISFEFSATPPPQSDFIGAIEVFDDDGSKISYDLLPISGVISDHAKTTYATSFIDIEEVDSSLNPNSTIPFDLYSVITGTVVTGGSALNDNQDMRGADSKFYWYWFTAIGYQPLNVILALPLHDSDGDPEGEGIVGGATGNTSSSNRFSKIYAACAEDYDYVADAADKDSAFRETFDDIVAHEIGHGPDSSNNGDHDAELGLMSAGESAIGEEFSNETILRFRNADKWDE